MPKPKIPRVKKLGLVLLQQHFGRRANDVVSLMRDEIGNANAIEVRADPIVSGTWAILNEERVGLLMRLYDEELEALDTFELPEGKKSLNDLETGSLKFY